MQVTRKHANYLVIDNLLAPEQFQLFWNFIQDENFKFVHFDKWVKAFRLSDGTPMNGAVAISHPVDYDKTSNVYPTKKGIDLLIESLMANAALLSEYVGQEGKDWDYFYCRPYLYGAGSGLSWHTDGRGDAAGAYVYYAHPHWDASWGAELLIDDSGYLDLDYPERPLHDGTSKKLGLHLDNKLSNEAVMKLGVGHYILPKPNRLIILRRGVLHRINRVDHNAGDNVRASVTGFFLKKRS